MVETLRELLSYLPTKSSVQAQIKIRLSMLREFACLTNEIGLDFVFYKFDLDIAKCKLELFMYSLNK